MGMIGDQVLRLDVEGIASGLGGGPIGQGARRSCEGMLSGTGNFIEPAPRRAGIADP
jgi:hypothetical protein